MHLDSCRMIIIIKVFVKMDNNEIKFTLRKLSSFKTKKINNLFLLIIKLQVEFLIENFFNKI